ncbi:iron-containing alcohol dehydrogenase [Amycolatopsis rubida]|uniref:Iron-containing alcohol dehydrogenase n=1 Tax=Amycolatopsis rubida TaxID=112413 RepID=A0ABX0C7W6_9PSEU|nr:MULTISPECIES: iron-containing alcohol dehydrogenase [Amycolatopsis]MYW97433.1 iron-containing alcohol dehydrogenase [Amycolatopsis rubida]NEC62418.1 iron-containing alcohol dehydrogenase [Amycolatopsis rubida]OAP21579.1 NAD-dependent methanol dehydrogenase [Amycolatopsis sp. M39]
MSVDIHISPVLRIGAGSVDTVGALVASLGARRPLVVTDGFLASSGLADRVAERLRGSGADVEIFAGTIPDPTTESLVDGLSAVRAHDADSIVAVGGGSPIDTAKALAVLAVREGPMRELKAPYRYDGEALPVVAVPTTAGTGSEATMFTIITDSESGEKMLCAGRAYLPSAAIVDYELTMSMPPRLTADTGIDALTHAIEAYVSKKANAVSDTFALSAISRIGRWLRPAYADGADVRAREELMTAATLAGIAFSNSSVALVHGMSRPLGAHFHIAHGMANAMLFAEVTAFSVTAAEERYATCARTLGVATDDDSDAAAAEALVRELRRLAQDLEVPTPAGRGVDRQEWDALVPVMAEQALASGSPGNNPRVPTAEEIEQLYAAVYA